MFNSIDPMNSTGAMLDLIAKKQKAIGENLANMDTPGYVRKDVDFGQYMGTSGNALEAKLIDKFGNAPIISQATSNGQPIDPANELLELQKNSLLYTMATRRMSSIITEMKTVINVGK